VERTQCASWTVLRPDGIVGPSLGSPMNLARGIGVYAAICRELGLPLRFPGSLTTWSSVLHQLTDTAILGRAVLWSLDAVTARGEIFNVINGDQFRWKHISPEIAAAFEMTVEEPQPMPLKPELKSPLDQLVGRLR
jgi:nucleoside-diphosphate-sugar epimerase